MASNSWARIQLGKSALLALIACTVAFLCANTDLARYVDWTLYEAHFPTDRQQAVHVVLAEVDDASLRRFGPWPMDRGLFARAAENALAAGATAVAFDVMFDRDRSPEGDRQLAELARVDKRVAFAYRALAAEAPRFYLQLALAGPTAGHVDAIGGIRNNVITMIADVPGQDSLALVLARVYCEQATPRCLPIVHTSSTDMTYERRLSPVWGLHIATPATAFPRIPFHALVSGRVPSLQGKIVVVSPAAEQLGDLYWIPQGWERVLLPGSVALAYGIETAIAGTAVYVLPAAVLVLVLAFANFLALGAFMRWRHAAMWVYLPALASSHWLLFRMAQLHVPFSLCVINALLLWLGAAVIWPPRPKNWKGSAVAVDSEFLRERTKTASSGNEQA